MNFEQFVSDIKNNNWNVHGVEVYQDGQLIYTYGDTEAGIYDIYSCTKSIVSIAVGIAYDRGLIELDSSILKYMPSKSLASVPEEQKADLARISVRRLLTMSVVGFPFRPEGDNYLEFALNCKLRDPDKAEFNYSNICVYLVCVALQQVLKEDLGVFIEKNIFQPLQITQYEYGRSPEGIFYGASKTKLSVHSLSKLGILMMNKGEYQGERLISEEYAELATSIQQINREGGYGFYFWKYRDGFSINGKWKQKCYCLPKAGLMVTYLAHIEDDSHDLLNSMERNILDINHTVGEGS